MESTEKQIQHNLYFILYIWILSLTKKVMGDYTVKLDTSYG